MNKLQITNRKLTKTICARIAEQGHPISLPAPWHHLKARGRFFQPPADTGRLLANLRSEFSTCDLVNCGAVVLDSAGAVSLAPMLLGPDNVLYAPRQSRSHQPVQLLNSTGVLPSWNWSTAGLLQDYYVRRLLEGSQNLVVADNLRDVAALWAGGIPALPAAGLTLLAEPRLSVLRRVLNIPSRPDTQRILTAESISWGNDLIPAPRMNVIFANWSVAELALDPTDRMTTLCAHFRNVQTHLLPPGVCRVWIPQPAELERLQFCLRFGDKHTVKSALVESMSTSSQPLVENHARQHTVPANGPTKSTFELIDDCLKLWPTLTDLKRRQRVWNWVLAAVERELVQPLRVAAESASDPAERERLFGLAQMARILHPRLLELTANCMSAAARGDIRKMARQFESIAELEPLYKRQASLSRPPRAAR